MNQHTTFVVCLLTFLFWESWSRSLLSLFGVHFWDRQHVLEIIHSNPVGLYNSTAFAEIAETQYSPRRYIYLLPHIIGAIIWWNLYFLQLIPKVRHAFNKRLHRWLGRLLMVTACMQTSSGVGLALTSHSKIIPIVSGFLALAVFYCVYHAWKYAIHRDIPRHKYWVFKVVGYLQTIALQRIFLMLLITTHQMGWYGLYPDLGENSTLEEANDVVLDMFDHSFVFAIFTVMLLTEWYIAGEQGMMEAPEPSQGYATDKSSQSVTTKPPTVNEKQQPLLSGS
ncbi:expressed unknown protein [Seminavis robusta]|uniref:Uncharacterized protein n=1 Tax=Seminavis robusta TaxID=568900 RepID=A0A9N8E7K2_9STRA|nr:expressed unknown protein [Seminavis robusta]|eukprot:Sro628_g177990.1 n/a (281) ;mRNA; f:8536-9378